MLLSLPYSTEDTTLDKERPVEQWLDLLTFLVSERQRHFIIDYDTLFPLQDDIDLVSQLGVQM